MKRYLIKLVVFSAIVVIAIFLLVFARYKSANSVSWKFPVEKHILFMGASHVYHAIDDSQLSSAINLGQPSERYMYTYIKLKNICQDNSQIDTVFLQCSSTDLWQDTDYKYYTQNEQRLFVKCYWPFFTREEWKVILNGKNILNPFKIVLSNLISKELFKPKLLIKNIGGFAQKSSSVDPFKGEEVKQDLEVDHVEKYGDYGYEVNYHYLRLIIDFCKQNDIKLYLLYYPVYRPELFYDQDFCNKNRIKYFSDVEYLDYSNWLCDDDERLDAHHLNYKGADQFTKELKKKFLLQ